MLYDYLITSLLHNSSIVGLEVCTALSSTMSSAEKALCFCSICFSTHSNGQELHQKTVQRHIKSDQQLVADFETNGSSVSAELVAQLKNGIERTLLGTITSSMSKHIGTVKLSYVK